MRKSYPALMGCTSLTLAFLAANMVASAQSSDESIRNFDVVAKVNPDSSVNIAEHIVYDFGSGERHGILRDIPVKYSAGFGNRSIALSEVRVADQNGVPLKFSISSRGKNQEIRIGDPNILVGGVHTYVISYTVDRAIGYFSDHDEFYWNATGNQWKVPIGEASAEIVLPWRLSQTQITSSCYVGSFGSTERCMTEIPASTGATTTTLAIFRAPRPLEAGQGLTAALGFPTGLLHKPTQAAYVREFLLEFLKDNWIAALPIVTLFWMLRTWLRKGRDPRGRGTIVAEYAAPDHLLPLEVSALMHEGMKVKDISAEIIHCAVQGLLTIERTEEKHLLSKSTDYILHKKSAGSDAISELDTLLTGKLFGGADSVKLSDLNQKFYLNIPGIRKAANASVVEKGYFEGDPAKVITHYVLYGFAFLGIFGLGLFAFNNIEPVPVASLLISGIVIFIFAYIMPCHSEKGVRAKEAVLGLKEYLQIAEKDRINFHDAPGKNPKLFEKLLPYAMVLGVEKAWAREFEDIYRQPPNWYNDPYGGAFNSHVFVNDMSSFSSAASSTLVTSPSSSASGSDGGGSSGGGGGGGGGSSW